jgi:hypothetical protein
MSGVTAIQVSGSRLKKAAPDLQARLHRFDLP